MTFDPLGWLIGLVGTELPPMTPEEYAVSLMGREVTFRYPPVVVEIVE